MSIDRLLEENPVICAVKNEEQLYEAVNSSIKLIFVLFGDITNIKKIGEFISNHNKIGILHVDLVEGLSNKDIVIKFLKEETKFKGIISTKSQMIKGAKNHGLIAIQRVFVYDTISLSNVKIHMIKECDAIEVLPGVIPKVITIISNSSKKPIISGGLIEMKSEVIQALNSGATCVSTSKKEIWNM